MLEQTGPKATLRRLRKDWPDLRYALERLPQVARRLVDGALDPRPSTPAPATQRTSAAAERRRWFATVGGALLMAAAVWLGLGAEPRWLGWLGGLTGVLLAACGWPPPDDGGR
jgi:ferric-dicitrate binding protein FerR (iron transport regulator)